MCVLHKRGLSSLVLALPIFFLLLTGKFVRQPGVAGALPQKLLGSANDMILVSQDTAPTTKRVFLRDMVLSRGDSEGLGRHTPALVSLCLQNNALKRKKAFDNREARHPRFDVLPGTAMCGRFEPTRHDFFFYSEQAHGTQGLVLRARLDLTGFQGRLLTLFWQ